jgi:hypothetical protein
MTGHDDDHDGGGHRDRSPIVTCAAPTSSPGCRHDRVAEAVQSVDAIAAMMV